MTDANSDWHRWHKETAEAIEADSSADNGGAQRLLTAVLQTAEA